jgi:hypothetical protein
MKLGFLNFPSLFIKHSKHLKDKRIFKNKCYNISESPEIPLITCEECIAQLRIGNYNCNVKLEDTCELKTSNQDIDYVLQISKSLENNDYRCDLSDSRYVIISEIELD